MNPNDILQQQQAIIDQMMHRYEQYYLIAIIVMFIAAGINAWVLYMFYRCQRDAADELQRIRVICEFMSVRQASSLERGESVAAAKRNPVSGEDKYKPKESPH